MVEAEPLRFRHKCQIYCEHKAEQNKLKLSLGEVYADKDFVFAKDYGEPIQINNFDPRSFLDLIKKAGVKQICFRDLRHTCVAFRERYPSQGCARTLRSQRYFHNTQSGLPVTPTMQENAAQLLGDALQI